MVAASRLRLNSTDKKGKNIVKKDRAEKLEEKIQATNEDAIQLIATRNLEKIIAVLTERPKIASHILSLIEMGAYDSIDKVAATTEAEEKLPPSCNKVALLSKKVITDIILTCLPHCSEWFRTLPRNEPKKSYVVLFGYMAHISLESAVPSKKIPVLTKFFQERWRKYGCRLGGDDDAPDHKDTSILAWMLNKQAVYWKVDFERKVLTYLVDAEVELPDSTKALGDKLEKLYIEEAFDVQKAELVITGMKRSCIELWETEKRGLRGLDLPFFRKEVDNNLESDADVKPLLMRPAGDGHADVKPQLMLLPAGDGHADVKPQLVLPAGDGHAADVKPQLVLPAGDGNAVVN